MTRLNRSKMRAGKFETYDDLPRICGHCNGASDAPNGRCVSCGRFDWLSGCRVCRIALIPKNIIYCATSPDGIVIEDDFPGDECPRCKCIYLIRSFVDDFESFVSEVPAGFRILPEHGFACADRLEVFSFVRDLPRLSESDGPKRIELRLDGLTLSFGEQSRFFSEHTSRFSSLDLGDYGLDSARTIKLRPPPPYSTKQRQSLVTLVAKLQIALQEEYEEDESIELLETILRWKVDTERRTLALASAIREDSHPGRIVNVYRLMELVLEILIDAEIARKRRDRTVGNREFSELAATHKRDLKTRLRLRVERLDPFPESLLKELWNLLRRDQGFNRSAAFDAIANFRNKSVHPPDLQDKAGLPWDEPDFYLVYRLLMRLIIHTLRHDPGGTGA